MVAVQRNHFERRILANKLFESILCSKPMMENIDFLETFAFCSDGIQSFERISAIQNIDFL